MCMTENDASQSRISAFVESKQAFSLGLSVVITVLVLAVGILVLLGPSMPLAAFLLAALMCGISETNGRCGMSHIGMIAPLSRASTRLWFSCAMSYSVCGLVSSYLVGLGISAFGEVFQLRSSVAFFSIVSIFSVFILVRELGIVSFWLPQWDRQTCKDWMQRFSMTTCSGMWGAHIGLTLLTVITHGGLYPLVLIAIGLGLGSGEWIFVCFWLGRIVFMWTIPLLQTVSKVSSGELISKCPQTYHVAAVLGITIVLAGAVYTVTDVVT